MEKNNVQMSTINIVRESVLFAEATLLFFFMSRFASSSVTTSQTLSLDKIHKYCMNFQKTQPDKFAEEFQSPDPIDECFQEQYQKQGLDKNPSKKIKQTVQGGHIRALSMGLYAFIPNLLVLGPTYAGMDYIKYKDAPWYKEGNFAQQAVPSIVYYVLTVIFAAMVAAALPKNAGNGTRVVYSLLYGFMCSSLSSMMHEFYPQK